MKLADITAIRRDIWKVWNEIAPDAGYEDADVRAEMVIDRLPNSEALTALLNGGKGYKALRKAVAAELQWA